MLRLTHDVRRIEDEDADTPPQSGRLGELLPPGY